MSRKDKGKKIHQEIKQLLKKDNESLILELKEKAVNIEINKRNEFEKELLQLVQEMTEYEKRDALYEVLVSLRSIWEKYQPEKGLYEKFQTAFKARNFKEAEKSYKKLKKQGLDYIDILEKGGGQIIPLVTEEADMLLAYDKKELTFYTLQFKKVTKIILPESQAIIDVIAPFSWQMSEVIEEEMAKIKDSDRNIWILREDKEGRKSVVSNNIKSIISKKLWHKFPEHRSIYVDQSLDDVHRLSFFQNQLLLISKKSIYYYKGNEGWEKGYTNRNAISAVEPTKEGLWVGHKNGNVVILKNSHQLGVRTRFRVFPYEIKNMRKTGKFMLISSKDSLKISDHEGRQVFELLNTGCEIRHAAILNDNLILLHLANGLLQARELNRENIRWEINLGDIYDTLLTFRKYVICRKKNGETKLFKVPPFYTMVEELESTNVYVEKLALDIDPNAPVRYISDFIGRKNILDEIKKVQDAHFLLYGEPLVGKTSLLNILRETFSERARCCVVDMSKLLNDSDPYETFESNFIKTCLTQYSIKYPDLSVKPSCQNLRFLIEKIKGDWSFCVFSLDNFFIPHHFDKISMEKFKAFICSFLTHPKVRLIITCSSSQKDNIKPFFENFQGILGQRKFLERGIPLFSELEVKNALRKKITIHQSVVENIYEYTGRFPHLAHLYDSWAPGRHSVRKFTNEIVRKYSEKIFEYFRDLGIDASLLIVTCLYGKLIAEKMSYSKFYEKFPFLKHILPKEKLDEAIDEIDGYGSGLSAEKVADGFKVSLSDNAQLFFEAAQHISWIKNFKTLYDFTSNPDGPGASDVAHAFARVTGGALYTNEYLKQIAKKHMDKFYVSKLSEKGQQNLKVIFQTFIVIPIRPWEKDDYMNIFSDLHIDFQEYNRKFGGAQIFYVLLLDLHGTAKEKIKEDLEELERISIIDAVMMRDIIMAVSPEEKASQYIFGQLSIRERSPYNSAGAVTDELFFGREMEIALIRGLPENIGVFGTRTIGKTSLLRKIHTTFKPQRKWKVFDLDCSRINSEMSLLQNLAEKMEISFEQIPGIDEFRQYVTNDAETGGYSYLFLLDEVDRLVEYDIKNDEKIFNTFYRLSSETIKNRETAARFILFGFQQMFEQMKNPLSRLYNFMVFMPLKPLDKQGALALVTRPIENIQVRWRYREDAEYLVERCSGHPRLLQAACHALLSSLDEKPQNRDLIERADVKQALTSPEFREICMRFYHSAGKEWRGTKETNDKKTFLQKLKKRDRGTYDNNAETTRFQVQEFLGDIHRITILTAVRLLYEDAKDIFTIKDIQDELKDNGIDASPDQMRNILDRLCLSGNFRLRDESTLLVNDEEKNIEHAVGKLAVDNPDLTVAHPGEYNQSEIAIPTFTYEFGVKIYPELLRAYFGGLDQCRAEQKKLIKKGDWKEWIEN